MKHNYLEKIHISKIDSRQNKPVIMGENIKNFSVNFVLNRLRLDSFIEFFHVFYGTSNFSVLLFIPEYRKLAIL